jgi:hypothetical protein
MMQVNNREKTGNWNTLGSNNGTVTKETFELLLDHGTCTVLCLIAPHLYL